MGRNAKARQQRKPKWQEIHDAHDGDSVIIFGAKSHYQDEWPDTWLEVKSGGLFPMEASSQGELTILGHEMVIHAPGSNIFCIAGHRIFREGETGRPAFVISACLPSRASELAPYQGFVTGMIADMIRNEAISSYEEIARELTDRGVMPLK